MLGIKSWSGSRLAVAVTILALGVRVAYALVTGGLELREEHLDNDSPSYFEIAHRMADGEVMVQTWLGPGPDSGEAVATAFRPPLWPAAQAVVYSALGDDPTYGRLLAMAFDSIACGVLVLVGVRLHSRSLGALAGLSAAFWPHFISSTRQLMAESMVVMLVAVLLLAADRFRRDPSVVSSIYLGTAVAAMTLTRSNGALIGLVLVAWALWRHRSELRAVIQPVAALVLTCGVLVLPYTAWASARMDGFVPVSTSSGVILAGTFTDNVIDTGHPYWGWWDIGPAIVELERSESEVEWDHNSRDAGLEWIGDNPTGAVEAIGLRSVRFLDLYWDIDGRVETKLTSTSRGLTIATVLTWWAVAPIAIVGLVLLRRRRREGTDISAWVPALLLAGVIGTTSIVFGGANRYRVAMDPIVILLAAFAVLHLWQTVRTRADQPNNA